jgi:hypothetical protein
VARAPGRDLEKRQASTCAGFLKITVAASMLR